MIGPLATLAAVACYGGLHSLLASLWAKERARALLGPAADRFYRLGYNLVGVLTLFPVLAVAVLMPDRRLYQMVWPLAGLALAAQAGALALLVVGGVAGGCLALPGGQAAPGTLFRPGAEARHYRAVGWVRHPLYTAGLLLLWLTPLLTANLLALNLGLTVYILVGSQFEERRLLEEFGQAYLLYRTSVPALLPRPWGTPMSLRAARRGASFAPLSG